MTDNVVYTSQSRLHFDPDRLVQMGIQRAYVTPFTTNNELLADPDIILANLDQLARKARIAADKGLQVYPFFVTINHPEGNYQIPPRYRRQQNLDGSPRSAFICFRDAVRQQEMIRYASYAALINYNSNPVRGRLHFAHAPTQPVHLDPHQVKLFDRPKPDN